MIKTHPCRKTYACVGLVQTYTLETQHKCEPNKHIRHKMNACAKKYDACVGIVMDTFEKLTYVSENQRMCQVRTHNNVWNTARTFWKEAHTSQNGCMRRNITVLAWKIWCIRLKYTHICPKICVYVRLEHTKTFETQRKHKQKTHIHRKIDACVWIKQCMR